MLNHNCTYNFTMSFPNQPASEHPQFPKQQFGATNWQLIHHIQGLSVPEKNERAFAAAQFALNQKRLILSEENPLWSSEKVEQVARRIVFGVSDKDFV